MTSQFSRLPKGIPLALVLCATLQSGCVWSNYVPKPRNPFVSPAPCVLKPTATKDEVIAHLNANISRLTAWRSSRVGIQLKQQGMIPVDLTAQMAVESPKNFRLRATSILGEEADFGSNPERFWFWIKRSPQPYVMTAAHEETHIAQQKLPLPFEPDWVMEAMGVTLLNPEDYVMQMVDENRVNLASRHFSANGEQVTKIIGVDLCSGQMVEHSLYDALGNLIARARMSDHTRNSSEISVPHRITLEWPQAGTTMKLSFLDVEINPTYSPESMWTLPQTIAPVVNLGSP